MGVGVDVGADGRSSSNNCAPPPQPSPTIRTFTPVFDGLWGEGVGRARGNAIRKNERRLMPGMIRIIGAGLAGLSAAVSLGKRGRSVTVHEATSFAGGRCRSYHDAAIGMTIDNGNHLLLSGNAAALGFARNIGSEHS